MKSMLFEKENTIRMDAAETFQIPFKMNVKS